MADEAQMGPETGVHIGADGKMRRHPSRGMYVLPSLFTAGNMAAGYYAITQSIQGSMADQSYFDRAALALGIAVLFDGLDGMIARMTNTASDFGKELDSLADVITFGVASSLLAYIWGFRMLPEIEGEDVRGAYTVRAFYVDWLDRCADLYLF